MLVYDSLVVVPEPARRTLVQRVEHRQVFTHISCSFHDVFDAVRFEEMTTEVFPLYVAGAARGTHQTPSLPLMMDPVVFEVAHVLAQAVRFALMTDERPIGVHWPLVQVLRSL